MSYPPSLGVFICEQDSDFSWSLNLWFSMSGLTQFTHGEKMTTFINEKIWVHFQFFICFPLNRVGPAFVWLLDNSVTSLIPVSSEKKKSLKCDMQFQRKREKQRDAFSSMKGSQGSNPKHFPYPFFPFLTFLHLVNFPSLYTGMGMENLEVF